MHANVIAVIFTQREIVFVEFPIPDGMVFSLVMRFHTFHYRIFFWAYYVDWVKEDPLFRGEHLKIKISANTREYIAMGYFEFINGGHSSENNSLRKYIINAR